jgi:hypothetical protein
MFQHPLMNKTSKLFSFNVWESFLVLERTKSDLSKNNWCYGVIRLHFNSFGALGKIFIVSLSYQTSFGFLGLNLNPFFFFIKCKNCIDQKQAGDQ